MEALLSRRNVFSTPVSSVKQVDTHTLVSDKPFLAPVARPAGPAGVLVAVEATETKGNDSKTKKKSHKSRRDKSSDNVKASSLSERDSVKKSDGETEET